ncbi:hypothetical protein D5F01_LYC15986 [Larimichthys crocea]|uniref:Uncharacterized protein n=1 Tax=Larimichthys crocea TaxID=215358 RepID=A0A6G0I4V0_LARCR|nr:hypothetical protein D5F01_LYC15986 [Larimichthys crocea]
MAGGRFIGLEGTVNVPEEEGDAKQELCRRLCQAEDRYRSQKKLHDYMLEDGEEIHHQLTELEADNMYQTRKVNELTRVVENHREKRCFIYIKQLEMENKELREENECLTAELDRRKRNLEEVKNLRRAEQELKHTLEEIQDDLCAKDKKITENARLLARKNCDLQEHYVTIQDLQQKRKQLEARL